MSNNFAQLMKGTEKEHVERQVVAVNKKTLAKLHALKSKMGNVSIMKLTDALLLDGIERAYEQLADNKKKHI